MGIILADKVVQTVLKTQIPAGVVSVALIDEVFEADIYTEADMCELKTYFGKHKVYIKPNYPLDDKESPALYVVQADANQQEDLMDAVDLIETSTEGTLYDGEIYKKSVRISVTADNVNIVTALAGIVQYLMMQAKPTFGQFRMMNVSVSSPEFDLIDRFIPQTLFYKTVMVNCSVVDLNKRETAKIIKTIDVDITNFFGDEVNSL